MAQLLSFNSCLNDTKMKKNREPLISIITVNYNTTEVTKGLIESIILSSYTNYEVIVVDNGSQDNSALSLQHSFPFIKLITSERNLGFAGGNNLGIDYAVGEYVFFVNNDTVFTKNLLTLLCKNLLSNNSLGAVSPMILFYDNPTVIQYVGSTKMNKLTIRNKHVGNGQKNQEQFDGEKQTFYAHGAAMMLPMKVIDEVGLMCTDFFLYYEELDWCERIRSAGYAINVVPRAKIYHKESMSTGKNSPLKIYYMTRSRFLFARRNLEGANYLLSALFLVLVAWPKNVISLVFNRTHLLAYSSALLWNLSNGKFTYKPF
ncbi:MAG: GT2 family glycosyltransferase [Saprospiraceae bacterium]